MGLISSQFQILLNQSDTLLCQLRDHYTYKGHGVGIHDLVILTPGVIIWTPVDNFQDLERAWKSW